MNVIQLFPPLRLDWGDLDDSDFACAETEEYSIWVERQHNPDGCFWLWSTQEMKPGLPLKSFGLEGSKRLAILAAEEAALAD